MRRPAGNILVLVVGSETAQHLVARSMSVDSRRMLLCCQTLLCGIACEGRRQLPREPAGLRGTKFHKHPRLTIAPAAWPVVLLIAGRNQNVR